MTQTVRGPATCCSVARNGENGSADHACGEAPTLTPRHHATPRTETFGFSEFRKPDKSMAMEERLYRESRLCRLFGNPVAYSIVAALLERGEMTPTQIAKAVGRSVARVSNLLAALRLAEVVRYQAAGGHQVPAQAHVRDAQGAKCVSCFCGNRRSPGLTFGLSEFRKSDKGQGLRGEKGWASGHVSGSRPSLDSSVTTVRFFRRIQLQFAGAHRGANAKHSRF